jgi:hypothetical protein
MFVLEKPYLFVLGMCICIYSQSNSTLDKMNFNGGRPPVDTIPDTTYYQSENFTEKEKVYSILHYNVNKTVKQYTTYLINGEINYYCLYDYSGTQCTKERYYNSKNQLTGYADYTSNSFGGKNYTYFNKDAIQLYEIQYDSALSAYDSLWQCRVYTIRTANNAVYSKKFCQYSSSGWLEKEIYLNYKNDTTAIGLWGYDPVSNITAYTYSLKNGKYLTGQIPGIIYDCYQYFYYANSKRADSCKIYKQTAQQLTLQYTIKYIYDSKGWLLQEKYFNNANVPVYRGEYTFDKTTLTTFYRSYQEPSLLLNQNKTDYRGIGIEFQQYNTAGKLQSIVKYRYNEGLYWDTVYTHDSTGILLNYVTYSYYLPYYIVKNYTTFDAQKKMLFSYNYDEFGNVKDSVVVKTKRSGSGSQATFNNGISFHDNSFIINSNKNTRFQLQVFDLSGKMLYNRTSVMQDSRTALPLNGLLKANGNYLYYGSMDSEKFSGMFYFNF